MTVLSSETRIRSTAVMFAAIVSVALLAATAIAGPGSHDHASHDHPVKSCAAFTQQDAHGQDGAHGEIVYDIETHVAEVAVGPDRWRLDGNDPECRENPAAARVLEQERAGATNMLREACEDMRSAVAQGRTHERGQEVNLDGARQYIDDFCQ